MAAEAKASKIVSKARQERGERLKQAKAEAEQEILLYRQQQENTFKINSTELLGDDSSVLEAETERDMGQERTNMEVQKNMGQSAVGGTPPTGALQNTILAQCHRRLGASALSAGRQALRAALGGQARE